MTGARTIPVQALHCPQCGAPAQVHPGDDAYHCRFCQASFVIDRSIPAPPAPMPPAARPPAVFPPQVLVGGRVAAVAPSRRKSGAGCVVGIVLVVAAIVAAPFIVTSGVFSSWNGKTPLVCSGNDWITVDHVTAKFDKGAAIDASGNCWVTCTDCKLSAPTVIKARENAQVNLGHGTADGEVFTELRDNASVSTDHTKTTGKKAPEPTSESGTPEWPSSGPFVCGKANGGGEFKNVKVKVSSGAAIIGSINCHLKLTHCTIEGPVGLLLNDNASVELDDCEVHATDAVIARANGSVELEGGKFIGTDHAVLLQDNASLRAHGTHLEGSKSTSGNAKVEVE